MMGVPNNYFQVQHMESYFFFLKKWANPGLFFVYFQSFQTNITIFTTNICEKMSIQYTVPGFEPMTFGLWVSSHNHYTRAPAQGITFLVTFF